MCRENTEIHGVSNGAPWTAEYEKRVVGLEGSYMVDFYLLCVYFGAAGESILLDDRKSLVSELKGILKREDIRIHQRNLILC